jgi:ectoine hydroxylase-related dioxygenase (phytanoyl-CoA dioxygenase family)
VDITVENGGTEFWLATHRLNHFEDEQQSVVILAKAGQPLLFDYRIRHRGLANRSQQPRPLLYVTFARASYEDKVRRLRHASLATTHVNTSAGYQRLFCHQANFSTSRYRKLPKQVMESLERHHKAVRNATSTV